MQSSSIFQILYFGVAYPDPITYTTMYFIFPLQKDTEQEDMKANEK